MTGVKHNSGRSLVALATCRCGRKKTDDFDLLCPICSGIDQPSPQPAKKEIFVAAIPVDDWELPDNQFLEVVL